jgi:hypothetical protein
MMTSWRRLTGNGRYLLLAAAATASCRTGGLCESTACSSEAASVAGATSIAGATSVAGATGVAAAAGEQPGTPPSGGQSAVAHAGGEAGAAGDSSGGAAGARAGEAAQPARLECEGDLADCDESRLTGCETDLTWSVRHCGACGGDCDGACVAGRCQPSTLVADQLVAQIMVASATTGFARTTDGRGNSSIVRVDMESGEGEVIQPQVADDVVLALGADRVYFFYPTTKELRSTGLDGASLTLEQELVGANAFGASPQGAYYVESETDPDTWEETETLWFRATGTVAWKKLRGPGELELRRSSPFGVVASEHDVNGVPRLLLLRGDQVTELGDEPDSLVEAVATRSAVVALSGSLLHWFTPSSIGDEVVPLSYEIDSSSTYYDRLIVLGDSVAILSENGGKAAVRFYSSGGPAAQRYGIAPTTNLVFADSSYLWYGVEDNWLERRFLRSRWFDLLP